MIVVTKRLDNELDRGFGGRLDSNLESKYEKIRTYRAKFRFVGSFLFSFQSKTII